MTQTQTKWIAADQSGIRIEITADTAADAAREYVSTGNYEPETKTSWVTVSVWPADDEDNSERHKVEIEPREPKCTADEHDWQSPIGIVGGIKENPGVYGHGGGVTIQEVCIHCGCGKLTDTWAQDPEDGQQGLESVEYEPGRYRDQIEQADDDDE